MSVLFKKKRKKVWYHRGGEDMDIEYKVKLVQKMQDYLLMHLYDEDFDFETLYAAIGYSRRHADRCFQSLLGKTPREYYVGKGFAF